MKISYDQETDSLYIRLVDGYHECCTLRLNDQIALNIGAGEVLVGVEILDAKQAHTPPDSPLEDEILAQPPEDFAAKIAEIKQRGDRSQSVIRRGSTGEDLLKFAGTWHGDDLEECLAFLDATRSKAKANAMYFCYSALASGDSLGF
ncbi:DUF2283 domain-containing protein [Nostoc sp. KVJ3]|uniref:DUF2283 domain-containing protein n=1 Tax=Nostoc sp. KVJ3 TaxID=457945 RepID=UPI00223882A3|nr:DUF2283 domain-containing protein [Nostoc sp. KVJ3]